MANTVLTTEYVRKKVRTALGSSGVDVELTNADIDDALEDSIREFNRHKPQVGKAALTISNAVKKYRIDDLHPNFQGVTRVEFMRDRVAGNVDPFDPWFLYLGGSPGVQGGYTTGEYEQAQGAYEDAQKVFGSNATWRAQWEGDEYYLYIDYSETVQPMLCSYTYNWHVTPDDDATTGMFKIQKGDIKWVLDYAIARSKIILSYIRGKFEGIPGPEGDLNIDWSRLKEEGEREIEQLTEKIHNRRRPIPPIIG